MEQEMITFDQQNGQLTLQELLLQKFLVDLV